MVILDNVLPDAHNPNRYWSAFLYLFISLYSYYTMVFVLCIDFIYVLSLG